MRQDGHQTAEIMTAFIFLFAHFLQGGNEFSEFRFCGEMRNADAKARERASLIAGQSKNGKRFAVVARTSTVIRKIYFLP
jgi:hypothetical protein